MKKTLFLSLFLSVLFSPNTYAQDVPLWFLFSPNTYTQELPSTILEGHRSWVNSVVFSPDSKTLASGSDDNTIRLWDVSTGTEIRTLEGHTDDVESVVFSPDGTRLASASPGWDRSMRLWNVSTGTKIRTIKRKGVNFYSVVFSPDGKTLASRGEANTIRLWDARTSAKLGTLTGHTDYIGRVVFSPDGKTLASGGWVLRLWDVSTGTEIQRFEENVSGIAFSPDGKMIAGGSNSRNKEFFIVLWDVSTGTEIRTLRGHTDHIGSVAFSPNGKTLASGSEDNTVRLWDVSSGIEIRTLEGHTDDVNSVVFSPDGYTLASGSNDRTIRLWDWILWKSFPTRIRIDPYLIKSPAIGEQFTININIVSGENVGGYQVSLVFDTTALRYVESANGDYLPPGAFFVPPVVSRNNVTLGATSLTGVGNGDGTLAKVTFEVVYVKDSWLSFPEVILTDNEGAPLSQLAHSGRVFEPAPALLPSAVISFRPASVLSPAIGEQLTFSIDIAGGQTVKDFNLMLDFDRSALKYISRSLGNYLAGGVGNGDGTLQTVTFEVLDVKASTVSASGSLIAPNGIRSTPTFESAAVVMPRLGDVNRDGVVNILDLVIVASSFAQPVPKEGNPADVDEDGVVNIVDLVKVAGAIGGDAAAPSAWTLDIDGMITRAQVQQWLSEARQLTLTDATEQQGILYLEQLLAALTPKETALLPNYPNPFNPETWIPYELATDANVKITIYTPNGGVVRTLSLGHKQAGGYTGRDRAAYWDGRNVQGEPVASGVYFYTLTTVDFIATRKMLILK